MSDFQKLSQTGKAFVVLLVSYSVILVVALWSDSLSNVTFIKLSVTYAVAIIALALVYLIRREFLDDEKAKNDKFMD